MPYLATLEAVRCRLSGKSPLFVPPLPTLTSTDKGLTPGATQPARLREHETVQIGQIKIPVFDNDYTSKCHKAVYPSWTYDIIDCNPRYDEALYQPEGYYGDQYQIPLAGSEEPIYDGDELVGREARVFRVRPVETPVDLLIEIRAYAPEETLLALMVEYLMKTFPPRGFLRVPMKDGSYRSWDMLHQTAKNKVPVNIPFETLGIEREFSSVWTYKVEAYLDNTDCTHLVHCVRDRRITAERADQ